MRWSLFIIFILCALLSYNIFAQTSYLPLSQPFNVAPWNYAGTESVDTIPDGVVDWMLFELRSDLNTIVYRTSAFYCSDGKSKALDGISRVKYGSMTGDYYYVCIHRNSLSVMSAEKLQFIDGYGVISYDFRESSSKAYGDINAVRYDSVSGQWAFYRGDVSKNGIINVLDYGPISSDLFKTGYYNSDTDLNGVVNVLDYASVSRNLFKTSQVPPGTVSVAPQKLTIINATAKDTSQITTLPWRAYDGVTYTGDVNQIWTSQPIPEWITFDAGSAKNIKEVRLSFSYYHNGRIYGYSIQYSTNGTTWTTATTSSSVANQEWMIHTVNFNARYIRINYTSNNQGAWAGLYEAQIYGN